MHRSGTSCLTGIMQGLGVELGEVHTENLHNKRGNRENDRIVALNEAVLECNRAAWNNPRVAERWTPEMAQERDEIVAEMSSRGAEHWGFKDTRTLFTLPFWLEAIDEPRFIGTFRHPQRVALSLQKRDNAPLEHSWELWRRYNARLLELQQQFGFVLVDFDAVDDDYLSSVMAGLLQLGLDETRAEQGRAFFDPSLRNQSAANTDDAGLSPEIMALYDQLRSAAG